MDSPEACFTARAEPRRRRDEMRCDGDRGGSGQEKSQIDPLPFLRFSPFPRVHFSRLSYIRIPILYILRSFLFLVRLLGEFSRSFSPQGRALTWPRTSLHMGQNNGGYTRVVPCRQRIREKKENTLKPDFVPVRSMKPPRSLLPHQHCTRNLHAWLKSLFPGNAPWGRYSLVCTLNCTRIIIAHLTELLKNSKLR